MERLTLAERMYLTLIPLTLMGLIIAVITSSSLRDNATPLVKAQQLKELALTSLSLLLTQDDTTKTMMLDPDNPASNVRKIRAYDENLKVIARIKASTESAEVHQVVDGMSDLDAKVLRDIDTSVLEAVGDGKTEKAKHLYFGTYEPQRAKYEAYVRQLVAIAERQSMAASTQLRRSNANSIRNILGALLVGLIIVIASLAYLANSITKRMNNVVSRLNGEHTAAQSSTDLITEASRSLSEGVSSTSSAIQEIDGSVCAFASRLKTNDQHAKRAQDSSAKALQSADHASAAIGRLIEATKQAQQSTDHILSIIRVIDQISFKTNLLALNAAVEAARAGEAGAGFSVVADEVRNLAKSSAEAAQQTADLIRDSVNKSQQGHEISEHASQALANTIAEARKIHDLIDEIASNSHLQNENIQHITRSLTHIGNVGQKSAREAEKTHHVAETLRSRSDAVEEIIEELVALVGARAR